MFGLNFKQSPEVYSKAYDLISSYRKLEELRDRDAKLRKAKENYEDELLDFFDKHIKKFNLEGKPKISRENSTICYDKESIQYSGLSEEYKQLARSHIEEYELPVIFFKGSTKPYAMILPFNKKLYRKCRKIYQKLQDVSREIKTCQSEIESAERNMDWKSSKPLVREFEENVKIVAESYSIVSWLAGESREMLECNKSRCENEKELAREIRKTGVSLDMLISLYEEGTPTTYEVLKGKACDRIVPLVQKGVNNKILEERSKVLTRREYELKAEKERLENCLEELSKISCKLEKD